MSPYGLCVGCTAMDFHPGVLAHDFTDKIAVVALVAGMERRQYPVVKEGGAVNVGC